MKNSRNSNPNPYKPQVNSSEEDVLSFLASIENNDMDGTTGQRLIAR